MRSNTFSDDLGFWFFIIVFLGGFVAIVAYYNSEIKEPLIIFLSFITAGFFLLTCFLMSRSNSLMVDSIKKSNTFRILKDWLSPELNNAKKKVYSNCNKANCVKDGYCMEASVLYNYFDILTHAIETGYATESVLQDAYDVVFVLWYEKCEDWLDNRQAFKLHSNDQKSIRTLYDKWKT